MRRFLAIFLIAVSTCFGWDVGFDFRASAGLVTDPVYAAFVTLGTTSYPTTQVINGQSITFGWESASGSAYPRDRGTGYDPRLAGVTCQPNDGTTSVFRVDLPSAGVYAVGLALGDGVAGYPQNNHAVIQSSATTVLTVAVNSNYNEFIDAAGNRWQATAWPASNVTVQRTFGSTILRLVLGGAHDSNYTCISHLRVTTGVAVRPPAGFLSFFIQ